MTIQEVATKLVEMTRQGQFVEAIQELYAQEIVSVEAMAMPGGSREMKGFEAVLGKGNWWKENHEVHSATVEGPLVSHKHFAVRFVMDVTSKLNGQRMMMDELAVYEVKDGKVVREEFFYGM